MHSDHERLAWLNRERLSPRLPDDDWEAELAKESETRRLEISLVEQDRAAVTSQARHVPTEPAAFVAWFEQLKATGPGQGDSLFPWLAREATLDQMRWFLYQEVAGEAGFEDLVALAQLKLETQPKLEMARNYWDEMGRGKADGMHGPMLANLAAALRLGEMSVPLVWESLALGNIMLALALNRRYAYQAIGALGVIELTAPTRAVYVDQGLKRLGSIRHYYALHSTLDVKHSAAWNAEVLLPIVTSRPEVATAIAEGALLRLEAGRRCFERYRAELGLTAVCSRAA